jgi:hypothetical protein
MDNKLIIDGFDWTEEKYLILNAESSVKKIDENYLNYLKELALENKNFMFYVHSSPGGFFPRFCFVLDITSLEEYHLLDERNLKYSTRFEEKNFDNTETYKKFLQDFLYAEENKKRLENAQLSIEAIEYYEY